MTKRTQATSVEIINFLSAFMKEKVGRGPRDIKVKMVDNILIFFIMGILSPLEKCLAQSPEGQRLIQESRKLYLEMTNSERIPTIENIVGAKVLEHYELLNVPKETAVGVIVFDQNIV